MIAKQLIVNPQTALCLWPGLVAKASWGKRSYHGAGLCVQVVFSRTGPSCTRAAAMWFSVERTPLHTRFSSQILLLGTNHAGERVRERATLRFGVLR